MIVLHLYCPACYHSSGNAITVDWPSPLETRVYTPLICVECGREFSFGIDGVHGMRCWHKGRTAHLYDFLQQRRRKQMGAG